MLDQEVPRRFQPLYTIVLPLKLALFAGFGVAGTLEALRHADGVIGYNELWTIMLGATALLALAGLIYRREHLELYATIALVGGFATYPLGALYLAAIGEPDLAPLAIGLWALVVPPAWRIIDLVRTIRRRREAPR